MGYEIGGLRSLSTWLVLRGIVRLVAFGCVRNTRGYATCKLDLFIADSKLSLPAFRMKCTYGVRIQSGDNTVFYIIELL